MEALVRPFVTISSESQPKTRTPPAEENPEAFLTWGGPSSFSNDSFEEDAEDVGFNVDDGNKPERERDVYSEEGRKWRDFKVTHPDDPNQYAIVRRIDQISFSGPSGVQVRFIMQGGGSYPGSEQGSGQEPPAPPSLEDID